ncbi:MAG: DUF547 domain-containing protein [Pirellulales bacterium]|nr:DUF547 domain-containing protein [Pirellulales bacterium]
MAMRNRLSGLMLVLAAWCGEEAVVEAAETWTVGREVPAGELVSMDQVDHRPWDALLKRRVDAQGRVDYTGWKASAADQQALDQYLAALSAAGPRLAASLQGRVAFWINAYNALTIRGILREYPTASIRNHTAALFGYNIWKHLLLRVGGEEYSLDAIEHQVLRKMGEPRIHFAIVCASAGCPPLRNEAYQSDRLDGQLTENARAFFASPARFAYDVRQRRIEVSPILKWFAKDFGADAAAQMATIAPYLPTAEARELAAGGQARVSYLDYDWSLNERKTLPR